MTLDDRLLALEQSMRRWRNAAFGTVALLIVTVLIAAQNAVVPGAISATSISLVNADGRIVASLAPSQDGASGEITLRRCIGKGDDHYAYTIGVDGLGHLLLRGTGGLSDRSGFIDFTVNNFGSSIDVVDGQLNGRAEPHGERRSSRVVISSGGYPFVALHDQNDKQRVAVAISGRELDLNKGFLALFNDESGKATWTVSC